MDSKWSAAVVTAAFVSLISALVLVIYRLCFSPLAGFPGPKLAAATSWYETYYDVFLGGRFLWEIERMHQKYGPIVRINPHEIHINDAQYYSTVYAGPTKKRHKYPWFVEVGAPASSFSTVDYHHHRVRRGMISPYLSNAAVHGYESIMQEKIDALCKHMRQAMQSNTALEMHASFITFAVDVVSYVIFGRSRCFNLLDSKSLDSRWKAGINDTFATFLLARHFPILVSLFRSLPFWLTGWFYPRFLTIIFVEHSIESQFRDCYREIMEQNVQDSEDDCMFAKILHDEKSGPPSERGYVRLLDEAKFLVVAGSDAPSQFVAITVYHLLRNPSPLQRLREELDQHLPDPKSRPSLREVEKLPYLSAVIKEGLRISSVVASRLPRIAPTETYTYQNWRIPPGVPVSMSTNLIHRNPDIFPNPTRFEPERWTNDTSSPSLDSYPQPFSKGSQACLGPNMTHCWGYLLLATIFRRYELALFETDERNVKIVRDCFNGQTKPGYNQIKVKVLAERS